MSSCNNNSINQSKIGPLLDRIRAMRKQEQTSYALRNYSRSSFASLSETEAKDLIGWREKICHWTYSVIDHFDLHRETVAISIDLFDRYIATRGYSCDGSLALLTSLTTLYIAIKVNEKKKIKLSTLTQLSRGQFGPRDIERMELEILKDLTWLVHPPSTVEFTTLFLKFLPPEVGMALRTEIFEQSRYLAELAVCDPFFMDCESSTIAFAAILNVLESNSSQINISYESRERYFRDLHIHIGLQRGKPCIRNARERLLKMHYATKSSETARQDKENSRPPQHTSKHTEQPRDEPMRSCNDSVDSRCSRTSGRFRTDDSIDSTSVCSRGSRGSKSSKGSRGSKSSKKRFLRGRAGSLIAPFSTTNTCSTWKKRSWVQLGKYSIYMATFYCRKIPFC